jgi:uncharacterized protein with ATP-grasp and redox domains
LISLLALAVVMQSLPVDDVRDVGGYIGERIVANREGSLKKFDIDLTLVIKEEPILADATKKDISALGMERIVDRIVEAPGFAVGIDLDSLNGKFGKTMRNADLIIAKGMANFESISETDLAPVAYLLRTKCSPVANAMGLKKDINAVKLFSRRYRR